MVLLAMAWPSGFQKSAINSPLKIFRSPSEKEKSLSQQETLGILGFETARTMSRLVSLYHSLSDAEIKKLKTEVLKSRGVVYLNSSDEDYLLDLARAEKMEDLTKISATLSRLSRKCSDSDLQSFDRLYRDFRLGFLDVRKLEYATRNVEKIVQKMDKNVNATANLYIAMECLNEIEASDRKLQKWKENVEPEKQNQASLEIFEHRLESQRKQVLRCKEASLWSKTYDCVVELMSQMVLVVHGRIDIVFAKVRPDNAFCLLSEKEKFLKGEKSMSRRQQNSAQQVHPEADYCLLSEKDRFMKKTVSKQENDFCLLSEKDKHLRQTPKKIGQIQLNPNPNLLSSDDVDRNNDAGVLQLASPSTVGGSGLAFRYANVVVLTECYLNSPAGITEEARKEFYDILPARLRTALKKKLRRQWGEGADDVVSWRMAAEEIIWWLGPVAHDTVQWEGERKMEKRGMEAREQDGAVLALQTLHFSDLEKTEAAIVEVLVALSCVLRADKPRMVCSGSGGRRRCRR